MEWNCLSTAAPRQSEIASRKSEAVSACLDDPFALQTIAVQLSFTRPKPDRRKSTTFPRSRAGGSAMCVRLTKRALHLTECASAASIRLTQCEPQTALYCASGRSSLRAATLSVQ